jgi:hypothetical protein
MAKPIILPGHVSRWVSLALNPSYGPTACGVDKDVTELRPSAAVAVARGNSEEARMKLLITTTVALSVVAASAAFAGIDPSAATAAAIESAAPPAHSSQLLLAQRRGKCQENLGYGRSGSYGCG